MRDLHCVESSSENFFFFASSQLSQFYPQRNMSSSDGNSESNYDSEDSETSFIQEYDMEVEDEIVGCRSHNKQ